MVLRALFSTFLWVSALASPVHDTAIRSIEKRDTPDIRFGDFTPSQQSQIQGAFHDALTLANHARHALTEESMDKVYSKYFRERDRAKVKGVFDNILGGATSVSGSNLLSSIEVVKDFKDPETNKYHCISRKRQALFYDESKPTMIICPVAFTSTGGIDRAYGNSAAVTCDTVGDEVSKKMDTMGSTILHEYTHFTSLVVPPLSSATDDHENKLHVLPVLAKTGLAVENAESYTQFANEALWTIKCGRWFDDADAESSVEEDC